MATLIYKAVEIITDAGLGIPVPGPLSQVGLASDGHIVIITGRPNIVTATGDTTRTDWAKGILAKDPNAYLPSEHADFIEAGCFSELGDFEFAVKNTQDYIATCEANGVYLYHRTVIFYHVTSSDGSTFNFERRGTYVIEEIPYTKLKTNFKCISNALDIFKSTPNQLATKAAYPSAPADSLDKPIPIAMGYVPFSPLLNVKAAGNKATLSMVGGVAYTFAGCVYVDGPKKTVRIKTNGVTFSVNDNRLVGKYLSQIDGAVDQTLRIISNLATNTTDSSNPYTEIVLSDPLSGSPVLWTLANNTDRPWFFEVLDLSVTLIASTKQVSEMVRNGSGQPILAIYNSDQSRYEDISEIGFQSSTTSIENTGFPGYSCHAKSTDATGDVEFPLIVVPKTITVAGAPGGSNTFPSVGAACPLLNDKDASTGYTMHMAVTGSFPTFDQFTLDLSVSELSALGNFEAFYVLPNFSAAAEGTSAIVSVNAIISLVDIYGRPLTTGINHNFPLPTFDTTGTTFNLLPQFYFGNPDNQTLDALYNGGYGGPLDISSLISDSKVANIYQRIRIEFFFNNVNGDAFRFTLNEIGIVATKKANLTTETIYASFKGEVAGTTWDSRFSSDFPVVLFPMLIEHLIRNYDTRWPVWQAGKAYVVGDKVRGTSDTGHIFVCTVAGTSHASVEPTWTDTTAATYTDGTATWKEWREIPIDTASFTTAYFGFLDWFFGFTMNEVKPTFEWIKDACEKGMLIGMVDRFGRVKIKPWRLLTTPLYAFTYGAGGNILEGTFEEMPMSDISRVYNDIRIRYDWNYAAGKFNQQLFITNIDAPQFPGPTEPSGVGTDLGAFTVTYADMGGGDYVLTFNTTLPHGMTGGEYVDLSGNLNGFNFSIRQVVAAADSGVVNYFKVNVSGGGFTASISSSGSVKKYSTSRLKWQDYVGGLRNYARAKGLWLKANASFKVTGVVQKLPENLGDCKMFIDPYAQFNGQYIWSDDGGTTPLLDVGDEHPAVFYADALLDWNPWPKRMPMFEVADESPVSAREVGDCVSVIHPKHTQGNTKIGWIYEKTPLPRDDEAKLPERFRIGVILKPEMVPESSLIIESGSWPDTITESGSRTDTYTEGA